VSTAIFSLRNENHKVKVFRASLMGNLPRQIASAGLQQVIAAGNYLPLQLQGLILSCRSKFFPLLSIKPHFFL
ncbi:MAG: hypothetical protein LBK13_03000, partial [Spirochaetales bacterium]|nr:hypothetical protein [Spirochaetales bacterium]